MTEYLCHGWFASRSHNPRIFAFIPFRGIWLITEFSTPVTRQIPLEEQEWTAYLSIPSTSVDPKISLEFRWLIINLVDHCLGSPLLLLVIVFSILQCTASGEWFAFYRISTRKCLCLLFLHISFSKHVEYIFKSQLHLFWLKVILSTYTIENICSV